MSQSKSKLLNYISLLLSDDEALQRFLIDPITDAEGKYGLTKAERAVLRRTVFHLSNRSLNGYTLVRHLGSYRRSLRLLQNVLHNVGSKMAQEAHVAATTPAPLEDTEQYTFTVVYYLPVLFSEDFTGQPNSYVGNPYANAESAVVTLSNQNPTIQNVMDAAVSSSGVSYLTDISNSYVTALSSTFEGWKITADFPQDASDYVFWFWSINGTPRPSYVGDVGVQGASFTQQQLAPNDTVYWQLIAPDSTYGFMPCDATDGSAYAKAAKAAKASKT